MTDNKFYSIIGLITALAFLAFLSFLVWQTINSTKSVITTDEIEKAREIARRLE